MGSGSSSEVKYKMSAEDAKELEEESGCK
jgi:hypothetical protein